MKLQSFIILILATISQALADRFSFLRIGHLSPNGHSLEGLLDGEASQALLRNLFGPDSRVGSMSLSMSLSMAMPDFSSSTETTVPSPAPKQGHQPSMQNPLYSVKPTNRPSPNPSELKTTRQSDSTMPTSAPASPLPDMVLNDLPNEKGNSGEDKDNEEAKTNSSDDSDEKSVPRAQGAVAQTPSKGVSAGAVAGYVMIAVVATLGAAYFIHRKATAVPTSLSLGPRASSQS